MLAALILSLCLSLFSMFLCFLFGRQIKGLTHDLKRERSSHDLQVRELLDRLAHKEGRPWTLPPREVAEEEVIPEDLQRALEGWKEV